MTTQADRENHRAYTRAQELIDEAHGQLATCAAAGEEGSSLAEQIHEVIASVEHASDRLHLNADAARTALLRERMANEAEIVETKHNV